MTIRITNTILLKRLIDGLGHRGQAKLEIGADISRSTIRDMLSGRVPSQEIREKVAAFFDRDEDTLFPLSQVDGEAA